MPSERDLVEQAALDAQIEPQPTPAAPTCGTLELSATQCEAIRGIITSENALQKSVDDFRARKQRVIAEILAVHDCPPTSNISVSNFDTGAATWTLPQSPKPKS